MDKIDRATEPDERDDEETRMTTIRASVAWLARVDRRAKELGISRTAYVLLAVSKAIESGL